jgi:hypothetical protein
MKVTRKYISCSCESETILLEKYKGEEEVYLSLFARGLNIKRYHFLDRLRHIWQILTKGFPYTDEIVLTKQKVKEFIIALNKLNNEN